MPRTGCGYVQADSNPQFTLVWARVVWVGERQGSGTVKKKGRQVNPLYVTGVNRAHATSHPQSLPQMFWSETILLCVHFYEMF